MTMWRHPIPAGGGSVEESKWDWGPGREAKGKGRKHRNFHVFSSLAAESRRDPAESSVDPAESGRLDLTLMFPL